MLEKGEQKKGSEFHLNRSESRYSATAERMDQAFLHLPEKKDFAYITVKETCEAAGGESFYVLSAL